MDSTAGLPATARRPAAALAACTLAGWVLGLSGCGGGAGKAAAPVSAATAASGPAAAGAALGASGAAAASAPPVSVTLVQALARDFTITLDASGTVASLSSVDVKSQVSAMVQTVHVKEGQFVQRGQPLFTLDARIDTANLRKAEAQLLKDQATLTDATRQLARSQDLLAQNFISQGAVDTSQANVDGQQALLAADRAAIDAVKAQLSFARITAPSSGRVGTIAVWAGSSVAPSGPALLTITQTDPIAVVFNLPQRNLSDALKALASGKGMVTAQLPESLNAGVGPGRPSGADSGPGGAGSHTGAGAGAGAGASSAPAAASGAGGAMAGASDPNRPTSDAMAAAGGAANAGLRQGKLSFVDSSVDGTSGTVKVKAEFANKDQALWPGAYVSVKMALQTIPGAIVVPQAAIVQGARGTAVFAAGPDNLAVIRPVKILATAGGDAAVSGLKPGERIVLDGRQNVRPGTPLIERAGAPERGALGPRGGLDGASALAGSGTAPASGTAS